MSDLRERIKEVMQEHGFGTNAEMAKWAGVSRGLVGLFSRVGVGVDPLKNNP